MDLRNTYRVVFHNDLDGICCAAHFLQQIGSGDYVLHPVKTQIRGEKFERLINSFPKEDTIVVFDFQYHERCKIWVDHHDNNVLPREYTKLLVNNTAALSAFQILAPTHAATDWVNMVDACKYPNVKFIFESDHPAMTLNRFIKSTFPHDMIYCRVAEILAKTNIDFERTVGILGLNAEDLVNRELEGCKRANAFMCVHAEDISVIFESRSGEYPRYAEFYTHPYLSYAIRQVSTGNGKCQIEIGYNPFLKRKNEVDIGKYMKANELLQTGGGHHDIGGGVLLEKHSEKFIQNFITTATNGECMEKLAVDPADQIEVKAAEMVKTGSAKDQAEGREQAVMEGKTDGDDSGLKL